MPRLPKDPEARAHVLADQALASFTTAQKQLDEANEALAQAHAQAVDDERLYTRLVQESIERAGELTDMMARNARIASRLAELTA